MGGDWAPEGPRAEALGRGLGQRPWAEASDRQTDRQTDKQTDKQTNRRTDKQTDRQA